MIGRGKKEDGDGEGEEGEEDDDDKGDDEERIEEELRQKKSQWVWKDALKNALVSDLEDGESQKTTDAVTPISLHQSFRGGVKMGEREGGGVRMGERERSTSRISVPRSKSNLSGLTLFIHRFKRDWNTTRIHVYSLTLSNSLFSFSLSHSLFLFPVPFYSPFSYLSRQSRASASHPSHPRI